MTLLFTAKDLLREVLVGISRSYSCVLARTSYYARTSAYLSYLVS
ncbi:hypothetical protein MY11210_008342 [Beauveria gryllotalpidicola]